MRKLLEIALQLKCVNGPKSASWRAAYVIIYNWLSISYFLLNLLFQTLLREHYGLHYKIVFFSRPYQQTTYLLAPYHAHYFKLYYANNNTIYSVKIIFCMSICTSVALGCLLIADYPSNFFFYHTLYFKLNTININRLDCTYNLYAQYICWRQQRQGHACPKLVPAFFSCFDKSSSHVRGTWT